jgi:hypothetical protein
MTTDTTDYTGQDGDKPWLCVANEVTASTIEASSADAGFEAEAVRGPQTYSTWSPASLPAWVRATFPSSSEAPINYVLAYIADGGNCDFQPQRWDGATWTSIGSPLFVAIGEAACLLWIFNDLSPEAIRLHLSGGSEAVYVATLKAGRATVIPYSPSVGYSPSALNPRDTYRTVRSQGGQVLGSILERSETEERLTFDNLTPDWVRANWPELLRLFRTEGVGFAWRPATYPDELVYGMVEGRPEVGYSSLTRMQAKLVIQGPRV